MAPNRNDYWLTDVPSLQDLDRIAGRVERKEQEIREEQNNQSFVENILHEDEMPDSAEESTEHDLDEIVDLSDSLRFVREKRREEELSNLAEDSDSLYQKRSLGSTMGEFKLYSNDEGRTAPPAYLVPRPEGVGVVVFDEGIPGNWDGEDVYNAAKLYERAEEALSREHDRPVMGILGLEYELNDYREALQSLEGVHAEPDLVSNDADMEEIEKLKKTTYRILSRLSAQTAEVSGDPEKAVNRTEELIEEQYDQAQPGFPRVDLGYE